MAKTVWKHILINEQNIKAYKGTGVLIQCPHNSHYDGYKFWHPSKLVRDSYSGDYVKQVAYTDDFMFRLKKYGNGKWNGNEVISEIEIGASEFEEMFTASNNSLQAPKKLNPYETHKPTAKTAVKIEAEEELIDNE